MGKRHHESTSCRPRKNLIIGSGVLALAVTAGLVSYFGGRVEQTTKTEHAEKDIPIPEFDIHPRGPLYEQPQGLNLPQEDFMELAKLFAFNLRTDFDAKFGVSNPEKSPSESAVTAWMEKQCDFLLSLDPRIDSHLRRHRAEILASPETLQAFLNKFLLADGKLLFTHLVQEGMFVADLLDVQDIKEIVVKSDGREVHVPILKVLYPSTIPADDPMRKQVTGSAMYDVRLGYIVFFEEETRQQLANEASKSSRNSWSHLFNKEGLPADYVDDYVDLNIGTSLRHEASHAFVGKIFPKFTMASVDKSRERGNITIDENFGIFHWREDRMTTLCAIDELTSVGFELASRSRYGPFHIYNLLKLREMMKERYGFAGDYLFYSLMNIPGLSPHLREKLMSSSRLTDRQMYDLCMDPAVTTEAIATTGKRMWNFGYHLIEQMEASL